MSAGGYLGNSGHVWAVKPNGEMICYRPGGRSTTLEPPKGSVLKLLSVSGMSVWGIKHNFKVIKHITPVLNTWAEGVEFRFRLCVFFVFVLFLSVSKLVSVCVIMHVRSVRAAC